MSDRYFYKKNQDDKVMWVEQSDSKDGEHLFTFDKKKIYNLFRDYPHELTEEELKIFNEENPFWKEFFGVK